MEWKCDASGSHVLWVWMVSNTPHIQNQCFSTRKIWSSSLYDPCHWPSCCPPAPPPPNQRGLQRSPCLTQVRFASLNRLVGLIEMVILRLGASQYCNMGVQGRANYHSNVLHLIRIFSLSNVCRRPFLETLHSFVLAINIQLVRKSLVVDGHSLLKLRWRPGF